MKIKHFIGTGLILLAVMVGAGYAARTANATLKFVQTPTITLYSSISSSATSMRVTPYPKDLDGNKLTVTDFGSSPTATIDPKVKNVEEIVGFTGITDNGDNTATLTGLTRDLLSKSPYTSAGTGRAHSASAIVVFSNNPQMYNRLAAKENNESIGGNWTFGGNPTFSATTTLLADCNSSSLNTQVCAKNYIDTRVSAGAANANETTAGLVQMATGAQAAAGTSIGSTAARLTLGANLSTSTCQFAANSVLVSSSTTGKLDGGCFNTAFSYTFSKLQTFNASTTIAASGTTTAPLILNGVPYAFPSSQTGSSSVLMNNGTGSLSWGYPSNYNYVQTSAVSEGAGVGYATSSTYTIPAYAFSASSTIRVTADLRCGSGGSGGTCTYYLRRADGTTWASCSVAATATAENGLGHLDFTILAQNSLSSQSTIGSCFLQGTKGTYGSANATSAINTSAGVSVVMVVQSDTSSLLVSIPNFAIIVTP